MEEMLILYSSLKVNGNQVNQEENKECLGVAQQLSSPFPKLSFGLFLSCLLQPIKDERQAKGGGRKKKERDL